MDYAAGVRPAVTSGARLDPTIHPFLSAPVTDCPWLIIDQSLSPVPSPNPCCSGVDGVASARLTRHYLTRRHLSLSFPGWESTYQRRS